MEDYYKVLGLENGAEPAEIKRAYFSLVRKYSPEKDPDKFREIREAYEHLKNMEGEQGPVFPRPKEPWAVKFLELIQKYRSQDDVERARDASAEAWRAFPDEIQFLYLLANAQRVAGNTGKAVKSCEELVRREPGNQWFWREMAMACQERGYTKKAYSAFARAYELGCRETEFLFDFSVSCRDYEEYDKGIQILTEVLEKEQRWKKEEMDVALDAFSGIIAMQMEAGYQLHETYIKLCDFMRKYSVYLEENLEILSTILAILIASEEMEDAYYYVTQEILSVFRDSCHGARAKELLRLLELHCMAVRVDMDERLGETVRLGFQACFLMEEEEKECRTYAMLDTKLCMLEERQEILEQLDIIEAEYPLYYEKIKEFAEKLRNGKKLDYYKDNMLRQYSRMSQYMENGIYFEKYPQERAKAMGTVVYRSDSERPYVRAGKKIGRNDPCPCGSGKKYKNCCMRK